MGSTNSNPAWPWRDGELHAVWAIRFDKNPHFSHCLGDSTRRSPRSRIWTIFDNYVRMNQAALAGRGAISHFSGLWAGVPFFFFVVTGIYGFANSRFMVFHPHIVPRNCTFVNLLRASHSSYLILPRNHLIADLLFVAWHIPRSFTSLGGLARDSTCRSEALKGIPNML